MTLLQFTTQFALPFLLMIIMFGLGLTLTGPDFTRVLRAPRPALVGILGHAFLLPLTAFAVLSIWTFPPLVAGGLVILAACPGGVTSNAVVYAGRGDVALAVSLTAISSIVTVFTIPLVVSFGLAHFSGMEATVQLDFLDTVKRLGTYILLPLFAGMALKYFLPGFAQAVERYFRVLALIIFIAIVIVSVVIALSVDYRDVQYAFVAVVLLLLGVSTLGYLACRLAGLDTVRTMTVVIETGVQNTATAYLIGGTILQEPGLTLTPAVYSVMMFITAGLVIFLARRRGQMPL